jgi:hypothetical protein
MSEQDKKQGLGKVSEPTPQQSTDSNEAESIQSDAKATDHPDAIGTGAAKAPSSKTTPDPFDPMNLGISTDYAAAINAQASHKPFELRKPNDQEFFRTSPLNEHHIPAASIADKQDMNRIHIVHGSSLAAVRQEFPRAVRAVELVVTQTLEGAWILWPVPLAEDRGGKWNSSQRAACERGKTLWTNMQSDRGQYEVTTVDNPRAATWDSCPAVCEILRQALSERLITSLDHPLLCKLRGMA